MLRIEDETTDHDALHFAIEREWKRDHVQRDFWRYRGYCRFYVPSIGRLTVVGPVETPEDLGPAPIAFAQLIRNEQCIVITTPLDQSYKWIIPL